MPIILCVDDEPSQLTLLEFAFKREGFTVLSALTGQEAIKLTQEHQPDVILMDLMMPGLDGAATTARIKALPVGANIPILVLTAYATGRLATKALAAGAKEIIPKGILPRALIEKVNNYLA